MDYGPFGFIEKFSPNWNMWVGGGDHYSFMNQNEVRVMARQWTPLMVLTPFPPSSPNPDRFQKL
jgi:uncharacterized protein YdiU (UPF0061 family)